MTHSFSTGFCKTIRWIGVLLALCGIASYFIAKGELGGPNLPEFFFPAMMLYFVGMSALSLRSETEKRASEKKKRRIYQKRVKQLGRLGVTNTLILSIATGAICFFIAYGMMVNGHSMTIATALGIIAVASLTYASTLQKPAN